MKNTYSELVIKAPFLLVKGLLLGFMYGRGTEFNFFFHRKTGIRRETFGELVRELLVLDTHTYLCLPDDVVDDFIAVVRKAEEKVQCKVVGRRKIEGAEFSFDFEFVNPEAAEECKQLLKDLPEGVQLLNFHPEERRDEKMGKIGGYAPSHSYLYRGHGLIKGDFGGVIDLYLKIKRSRVGDMMLCSNVRLIFAEKNK